MRWRKCDCPLYCKFCGARLKRDAYGHYCPTKNCQWSLTGSGCPCTGGVREERRSGGSRWQRVDPDGPAILAALFDEQWMTATTLLLMLRKTGLTLAHHDLWYRLRAMVGYDGRSRMAYGWRRKRTMPTRLAL